MPVYTYRCNDCGQLFEKKQSIHSLDSLVLCPQGHSNVQRVYTAPSIVFKGSGFYVTDHRSHPPASK